MGTNTPTDAPVNNVKCKNKSNYLFKKKKKKDCKWVANKPEQRCGLKDTKRKKKLVSVFCPLQCNDNCFPPAPASKPTIAPTPEPTPSYQEAKGCCSTDYKTCAAYGYCSESREVCETNPLCTVFYMKWLENGADTGTCLPRHS